MKKSQFTDSQILAILKQAESGVPVPELCRQHGMSSAAFYKWRRRGRAGRGDLGQRTLKVSVIFACPSAIRHSVRGCP